MAHIVNPKVCLDANVLLELIFERKKFMAAKELVAKQSNLFVTTLTVHIVMYYGLKEHRDPAELEHTLSSFQWLDCAQEDAAWAFRNYHAKDFEDGLQVASALRGGCKRFVTLDKRLQRHYAPYLAIDLL